MPKYIVEVETRVSYEFEIEAEDEETAEELAIEKANYEVANEYLNWEIEYVGEITEEEA